MNRKITLTTQEKIMNMAKLGIVSRAGNYFHSLGKRQKQRAGGLMRYTLCVFQDKERRNGSRYGFAFDIPAISGRALFSVGKLTRKSGSYVIPGLCPTGGTFKNTPKTSASLTACDFPRFPPKKTTVPALATRPGGAFQVSGGCHE